MQVTRRMLAVIAVFFLLSCFLTVFFLSLQHVLQGVYVLDYPLYAILASYGPAIAAVATALVFREDLREFGWGPGSARFYIFAIAFPLLLYTLWHGALWLSGYYTRNSDALPDGLFLSLAVSLAAMILLALGEEIGWRGFLVPYLAKNTGSFILVSLVSGILWAAWHYPFLRYRYSDAVPLWFIYLDFTIGIVGLSFVYCWLRLASGSIWPCVVLHALSNWLGSYISPLFLVRVPPVTPGAQAITLLVDTVFPLAVAYVFWKYFSRLPEFSKSSRHDAKL